MFGKAMDKTQPTPYWKGGFPNSSLPRLEVIIRRKGRFPRPYTILMLSRAQFRNHLRLPAGSIADRSRR